MAYTALTSSAHFHAHESRYSNDMFTLYACRGNFVQIKVKINVVRNAFAVISSRFPVRGSPQQFQQLFLLVDVTVFVSDRVLLVHCTRRMGAMIH